MSAGRISPVRPRGRLISWGLAALLTFLAIPALPGKAEAVQHQRSVADHAAWLEPHVDIRLPAGADGPVPAALLFHGCGGRRGLQDEYAAALNAAGYAAVIVDSLAPRGIGRAAAMTQVCTAMRLRGQARAADIFAAINLARRTSGIDPDRLLLTGWSHGGWALLDALTYAAEGRPPPGLSGSARLDGVAGLLLLYPYCSFPARSRTHSIAAGIPVDAVLAGRDLVASTADCRHILDRAAAAGVTVNWEMWPGQTHAFDEPGNPDPRMSHDPDAAEAARQRLIGLLDDLSRT